MAPPPDTVAKQNIPLEDLEFLMKTELLRATPDECKRRLISSMSRIAFKAGERFISQGERGDGLYVIQKGSCVVSLEKDGQSYPISRLKAGDLVGELAVLTGEPRSASVDAETDMALWQISLNAFDQLFKDCHDVQQFLTEIATERLCSQKITAERSIGRYTINEILAEGGWSIVYKGVHSFLNFPVAIKMLKHNMAIDNDLLGRFQDEAKIIARLNHENIVRVYDVEHLYRTVFIIMEHLDGVTLKHILENRLRLPYRKALEILIQVSAGLDYAHQQGIVHQDVKPGNIFIQKGDRVKIVDFGLACPIGFCSNDLPGTAFYMAPEQIEGEPVDPRTDIYSLGITAYEMATGQRPFPDDVCEAFRSHITEPTPDPRALNPGLPDEFSNFITRATQKDPGARYQSLQEVRSELVSLAQKSGAPAPTESREGRKMMSLFMFYKNENQIQLNRLLEDFSEQLKKLGTELRVANFEDV